MYSNNYSRNYFNRNSNSPKTYYIVARYKSKYGLILFCTTLLPDEDLNLNQCFIKTLYYKGQKDLKSGDVLTCTIIKDESGKEYALDVYESAENEENF